MAVWGAGAFPYCMYLLGLQIAMPHQWLEGNLPVSAKCTVCDKTCGSVLRLQDWRCLWCKAMVSERSPLLNPVSSSVGTAHSSRNCRPYVKEAVTPCDAWILVPGTHGV